MRSVLIIISCLLIGNPALSENASYIIKDKRNREIGKLKVERSINHGIEEILVTSEIRAKKMVSIIISYKLHSIFKQNKLQSNDIITFRNHLPHDIMSTRIEGKGYHFKKNSAESQVKDFNYCESMMYFNEPKDQAEVYSEFDGVFKSITHYEKENRYDLANPVNNNISKYFYTNGMLQKAIVKHPLMTLFLYRN